MTIQEAVKSGKPFRRPHHFYWMNILDGKTFFGLSDSLHQYAYVVEDILANDWEVKP